MGEKGAGMREHKGVVFLQALARCHLTDDVLTRSERVLPPYPPQMHRSIRLASLDSFLFLNSYHESTMPFLINLTYC